MRFNLVSGGWKRNYPWATEFAFQKGLTRLGHQVVPVGPSQQSSIDRDADVTLIFKKVDDARVRGEVERFKGLKFVYQTDDMRIQSSRDDMSSALEYCQHALLFEPDGVKTAVDMGFQSAHRLMLTAHDGIFVSNVNVPKLIDVCFVGSMSREPCHVFRWKMKERIEQQLSHLKTVFTSCFDVSTVVQLYNQSKVVLHHATDVGQSFGLGYGYQSRHFEAGFTGACVLSNTVINEGHISGLTYFSDEGPGCVSRIIELLGPDEKWKFRGRELRDTLTREHTPEKRMQEFVKIVESLG